MSAVAIRLSILALATISGNALRRHSTKSRSQAQETKWSKHTIFGDKEYNIYILDKSGSMDTSDAKRSDGSVATRDAAAVEDLTGTLRALSNRSKFSVVTFSSDAQAVFGTELRPATAANVDEAVSFISSSPGGSTCISCALKLACEIAGLAGSGEVKGMVLLADGEPTRGITSSSGLAQFMSGCNVPTDTVLFAVNTSAANQVMSVIAENSGGVYRKVSKTLPQRTPELPSVLSLSAKMELKMEPSIFMPRSRWDWKPNIYSKVYGHTIYIIDKSDLMKVRDVPMPDGTFITRDMATVADLKRALRELSSFNNQSNFTVITFNSAAQAVFGNETRPATAANVDQAIDFASSPPGGASCWSCAIARAGDLRYDKTHRYDDGRGWGDTVASYQFEREGFQWSKERMIFVAGGAPTTGGISLSDFQDVCIKKERWYGNSAPSGRGVVSDTVLFEPVNTSSQWPATALAEDLSWETGGEVRWIDPSVVGWSAQWRPCRANETILNNRRREAGTYYKGCV